MKDPKIVAAYQRMAPSEETRTRIRQTALARGAASLAEKERKIPVRTKHRHIYRVALVMALVVACLALLGVGGYAAVQKWRLPEPVALPDNTESIYDVHQTTSYGEEVLLNEGEGTEAEPLSDVWFIREAARVLAGVGLQDVSTEQMSVTRQKDLLMDREEVIVAFERDTDKTTLTFHAGRGTLLELASFEAFEELPTSVITTDAEAEACAMRYMAALPVPQGYGLTHIEKYDVDYWTLDFSHEIEPGVYNDYEMVRITINPQKGRLVGLHVFCFPLIDDHEEGDVALTQEEALAIGAQAVFGNSDWSARYTLDKAEVSIVLPNWVYTDYDAANVRYAENTRYAWCFTFEDHNSEFADIRLVWVDLYTGEVLGGDRT